MKLIIQRQWQMENMQIKNLLYALLSVYVTRNFEKLECFIKCEI